MVTGDSKTTHPAPVKSPSLARRSLFLGPIAFEVGDGLIQVGQPGAVAILGGNAGSLRGPLRAVAPLPLGAGTLRAIAGFFSPEVLGLFAALAGAGYGTKTGEFQPPDAGAGKSSGLGSRQTVLPGPARHRDQQFGNSAGWCVQAVVEKFG